MRIVKPELITQAVYSLCIQACCVLPDDVVSALKAARENEAAGSSARQTLDDIILNAQLAREAMRPCCQDTGMAVVFIDIGNEAYVDGNIIDAVNAGVRRAYTDAFMRKSVLTPIDRINTKDNTPAIVHVSFCTGDKININVAPKGFGSENMGKLFMLQPANGVDGIINCIVETVASAGACACPPMVIGVGVGGTMEVACLTAKRQLFREIGSKPATPALALIEERALKAVNALDIGPMGLHGKTTALAVHIGEYPTHIAGLPVAVNLQCHCARHASATL